MYEEVRETLLALCTPEYANQVLKACQRLNDAGLVTNEDGLLRLLEISENIDHGQLVTDIHNTVLDHLEEALDGFSVGFQDGTPLGVLSGALEAMLTIPNYGDPQGVVNRLQSDESPEEMLCELMGLTSDLTAEDYLQHIVRFSPSLLEEIERQANAQVIETPEDDNKDFIRTRLRRYVAHHPGTLIDHIIRDGHPLGKSLVFYVEQGEESLEATKHDPEKMAVDIVGLTLATPVEKAGLQQLLDIELEDIVTDVNLLTKVSIHFNKLLAEVSDE